MRSVPFWLLALPSIAALSACAFFEGWECGYGGPGCSAAPGLQTCGDTVARGAQATVRVTYFDDTGPHGAVVTEAESSDDAVLGVQLGEQAGQVVLTGASVGTAELQVLVEGWDDTRFSAPFVVAEPSEGEGEGEGEGEFAVSCQGTLPSQTMPVFVAE